MGFLPDIKNILKCLLQKRQTLLFSATMPENIQRLAEDITDNPVTVQISSTMPASTVAHTLYPVVENLKTNLLKDILRHTDTRSVLVFTRTKYRAQKVAGQLKDEGYRATSLQGNLTQNQRQDALDGFGNGFIKVLVATDIAARGIDVSCISHVINYDMPGSTDDYIHRIGRTGRIGKNGDAFTFVTEKDAPMARDLRRILKNPVIRVSEKNLTGTRLQAYRKDILIAPQSPVRKLTERRCNSVVESKRVVL
jgi:ATP-dependent RNA helicase RhlE